MYVEDQKHVREVLGEDIASAAEWRSRKAEQHPDDERNIWSSAALTAAARYVHDLSLPDSSLSAIAACWEHEEALQCWVADADYVIRRHGFPPSSTETPEELVFRLAEVARVSIAEHQAK